MRGTSASNVQGICSCYEGRIWSFRIAGSKLAFLDLFQDTRLLQCILDYTHIAHSDMSAPHFKDLLNHLNRGDIYSESPPIVEIISISNLYRYQGDTAKDSEK